MIQTCSDISFEPLPPLQAKLLFCTFTIVHCLIRLRIDNRYGDIILRKQLLGKNIIKKCNNNNTKKNMEESLQKTKQVFFFFFFVITKVDCNCNCTWWMITAWNVNKACRQFYNELQPCAPLTSHLRAGSGGKRRTTLWEDIGDQNMFG